jgi:cytochrome bd-type quinol oxidase subunit 1
MATEVQNSSDQSFASLVGEIVRDVQDLVKQQLQLSRREIEDDLRKSAEAASVFSLGAGICFLGAMSLCLALALWLHWLTSPHGTDPASFPLWACFAVVGGVLGLVGWEVAYAGRRKFQTINPLNNPATEALKENVQWLTTPK